MRVYLDANILVAVLNKEFPLFTYASRVVSLADSKKFDVFTSPICLAIAFYFAEKKHGRKAARQKMELLNTKIQVASVDKSTVSSALHNKSINDFEDGLEYYAALDAKCHSIITEDVGDFYFARMEVIRPQAFLEKYLIQ